MCEERGSKRLSNVHFRKVPAITISRVHTNDVITSLLAYFLRWYRGEMKISLSSGSIFALFFTELSFTNL